MLVYRVEGSDGRGPYTSNKFIDRWLLCSSHSDNDHPSPYADDLLNNIHDEEFCGFDSPRALLEWFDPKWRAMFEESHFKVKVYDSESYRVGSLGQTLFVKGEAVPVTSYSLSELEQETRALTH